VRLSLAHTGSDSFVATLIDSPKGVKTSRGKRTRRPIHALTSLVVMFSLLTVIAGSFASAQRTSSNWFSDAIKGVFCSTPAYFNEPQAWQNGLTSLGIGLTSGSVANVGGVNPVGSASNSLSKLSSGDSTFLDTRHTAYEKYGMSGTTWTVYNGEKDFGSEGVRGYEGRPEIKDGDLADLRREAYDGECVPVMGLIGTYFANSVFSFTKFFTSVSGWMLTQAYDPSWITSLNSKTSDVITGVDGQPGLRDTLYFPFLNLVIILAALYLFYQGIIKRRSTEAVSSALWMVGAVFVGSLFVYNPSILPDMTNQVVSEVTSSLLVGTAGATSNGVTTTNICYNGSAASGASVSEKRDHILLGANCTFWKTFVYEPWVTGQFGVSSSALDGNIGADGNTVTAAPAVDLGGGTIINNWGLYQVEQQSIDKYSLSKGNTAITEKRQDWYRVVDAVAAPQGDQALYGAWSGEDSNSRILVAMASLVAAIAGLIIVVVLAMSMLAYSIGTTILTFVAVFFLLIGAHPGMGRRMALRWAELYVGTVLKRIVSAVLLSLVLAFYGALLSGASDNWGSTIIAIVALSVAVLMYRKELIQTVTPQFGGSGFGEQGANKAGQFIKGVAGGAVLGGFAGMAGGAKGAAAIMGDKSKGSALRRVASATAAAGKSTAIGTGGGIKHGAVHAGGYGNNAILMAGNAGKRGVEQSAAKAAARAQQNMSASERVQAQQAAQAAAAAKSATPAVYASQQREADRAQEKYQKDWEKHHGDPEWNSRFTGTYGFDAPNPYESTFPGYGKTGNALTPDLMPRPIRPPEPEVLPEPAVAPIENGPLGIAEMMSGEGATFINVPAPPRRSLGIAEMMSGNDMGVTPLPSRPARPMPKPPATRQFTNLAEQRLVQNEAAELAKRRAALGGGRPRNDSQ